MPRSWIEVIRSNRLTGRFSVESSAMADALFTQMSMPPNRSTALATALVTDSSSRTSPTTASAWPPASSISAAAVWIVPGNLGSGSSVFASRTTLAPSRAAAMPMARPMPRLPPDIIRVRPARALDSVMARPYGGFEAPPEAETLA